MNCHKINEEDFNLISSMIGSNFYDMKIKCSSKVVTLTSIALGI